MFDWSFSNNYNCKEVLIVIRLKLMQFALKVQHESYTLFVSVLLIAHTTHNHIHSGSQFF